MNIETIITIILVVCIYEFVYKKYLAFKLEKFIMVRMVKYWLDREYSIQLGHNRYAINIQYKPISIEMMLVKTSPSKENEVLYSEKSGNSEVLFFELRDFKNKCIEIIYTDDAKETRC